ncbi:ATP-binding protein [Streptomyces sp. NPDC056486]|uniref:ATP-binding protein n=1 Tax=Streptomyces sp. NPDC056486 TaxID=3345835 RepID=UPI0036C17277
MTTHTAPGPRTEADIVLYTTRSLSGYSDLTPSDARAYLRATMTDWAVPETVSHELQLIVSELTTNALAYTRSPWITLTITLADDEACVSVSDRGPHRDLEAHQAEPDAEHGRGLLLVEALAHRWEQCESADGGTTVSAAIKVTDHKGPSCTSTRPRA